jgi:hypothetical protein
MFVDVHSYKLVSHHADPVFPREIDCIFVDFALGHTYILYTMKWNYRVFRKKINNRDWYYIKETYYDDTNEPCSVLEEPETGYWESMDELKGSLEMMLADANKYQSNILEEEKLFPDVS